MIGGGGGGVYFESVNRFQLVLLYTGGNKEFKTTKDDGLELRIVTAIIPFQDSIFAIEGVFMR